MQKTKADSENSWTIDVDSLGEDYDLSVKNPNKVEEKDERTPSEIYNSLSELNAQAKSILDDICFDIFPKENEEMMIKGHK